MPAVRSLRFLFACSSPALALAFTCLGSLTLAGCTSAVTSADVAPGSGAMVDSPSRGDAGTSTPTSSMFLGIGHAPSALANDDTHVYWSELGAVLRASKTNPRAERLFGGGDGETSASAIVVDGSNVYASHPAGGSLRAWSKKKGGLAVLLPEGSGVSSLAQDTTSLYAGTWGETTRTRGVAVISKSTQRVVATLRAGERVAKVAVWGALLFTAELEEGDSGKVRIVRTTTSGGEAVVVGHTEAVPYEIAVDGGAAYWVDERGLMSTRGGGPVHAAPPGGYLSGGLSVVDGDAFVTEVAVPGTSDGQVLRVPVEGGAPAVVATLSADPPAGAYRTYGMLQTFDREAFYVTTYWTSESDARRGDAIVKLRFTPKGF